MHKNNNKETTQQQQPTGTKQKEDTTMSKQTKQVTPKQQTTKTKQKETTTMATKQTNQPETVQYEQLHPTTQQLIKQHLAHTDACSTCLNYKDKTDYNLCINTCKYFTTPPRLIAKANEIKAKSLATQPTTQTPQPEQPTTKTLPIQNMYDIVNVTKSQLTPHSGYNLLTPIRTTKAITVPNGFITTRTHKGNTYTDKHISDTTVSYKDSNNKTHTTIFHTLKITETEQATEYALEASYITDGYTTPLESVYTWKLRKTEVTYTPKNGPVTRIKPNQNQK